MLDNVIKSIMMQDLKEKRRGIKGKKGTIINISSINYFIVNILS